MATINSNNRIKTYASDASKAPVGFVTPAVLQLSGSLDLTNILGSYGRVLTFFNEEPSTIPVGSLVIGDATGRLYEYNGSSEWYKTDPESLDYDGLGSSLPDELEVPPIPGGIWIDVTLREYITKSLENKTPFLWNPTISNQLAYPVSMFGSDGNLYEAVSGGNLNDDPTNGNEGNWQLFLDPAKGIIPTGCEAIWPTDNVPNGWILCDGRALSVDEYEALYQVLLGPESFVIDNAGEGYAVGNLIYVDDSPSGGSGMVLEVVAVADPAIGDVSEARIVENGTGYTAADTNLTTTVTTAGGEIALGIDFRIDITNTCIYGEDRPPAGTATFNVPDFRGRFVRGTDDPTGSAPAGRDPAAGKSVITGCDIASPGNGGWITVTGGLSQEYEQDVTNSFKIEIGMTIRPGDDEHTASSLVDGARVVDVDYESDKFLTSPLPSIAESGKDIVMFSRTDRGDGQEGNVVGTVQDWTFRPTPLREKSGGHFHSYERQEGGDNAGGGNKTGGYVGDGHITGSYRVTMSSGGSNTETRPKNIGQNWIIKA